MCYDPGAAPYGWGQHPQGAQQEPGLCPGRQRGEHQESGLGGEALRDSGSAALYAFVPPYKKDREMARRLHQEAGLPFLEVFVDTSFDECKKRDTKSWLWPGRWWIK